MATSTTKIAINTKQNIIFLAPSYPYVRQVINNLSIRLNQKKIPFTASKAGGPQYLETVAATIEFVYCDPINWTADTFRNRDAVFGRKELVNVAKEKYFGCGYMLRCPSVSLDKYIVDLANGGSDTDADGERPSAYIPGIKNVHFNDPMTIVLWEDGTKTIVKCQDGDVYSEELGLAMCIAKKALGNKGNFNEVFKKWLPVESAYPSVQTAPVTDRPMSQAFKRFLIESIEDVLNNSLKKGRVLE